MKQELIKCPKVELGFSTRDELASEEHSLITMRASCDWTNETPLSWQRAAVPHEADWKD
jgi:hypothetical protein